MAFAVANPLSLTSYPLELAADGTPKKSLASSTYRFSGIAANDKLLAWFEYQGGTEYKLHVVLR